MINKVKQTTFDRVNKETWEDIATKSLRGIPMENLITETAENIQIQPLYTLEELQSHSSEQLMNMIDSIREGKNGSEWTVAQLQYAQTGEGFIAELIESLKNGNEAIVYNGENQIEWKKEQLEQLATLSLQQPIYATNIKKDDLFLSLFEYIPMNERAHVFGAISGEAIQLPNGFEHIRTVCADTRDIHNEGADSVTELAMVLAQAADESLAFADFTTFSKQFFTYFSIDTHFFMEIAKLRAFRVLWRTFSEAYGETDPNAVPVFSENSLRTYSKLDPYVNLLRAGNEALSAVLGGTDMLTIHPHNVLTNSTQASIRTARNVQLVIKHETLIDKVIDPAGGSYFIETLTKELVEKAWALFLEIEAVGGHANYVKIGALEKRLHQLQNYRMNRLKHNEHSLIGTNIYADISTPIEQTENAIIVNNRLAEPYERLREYFSESQPKIALLTFGKLANFKPRTDFVSNYLAAGGLTCKWSPAFSHVDESYEWLKDNNIDYAVVCASVEETDDIMNEFIKNMPDSPSIDIAGNYHEEKKNKWQHAGVNGFIYKGQDQLAKLNEIKTNWKGVK